jgi:hypothetical protein
MAESCKDSSGTVGLNQEIAKLTPHFALPSISYWIFSVSASIDLTLNATLTGGLTPNGLAIAIEPTASVTASLRGGLTVGGFIGAGLFVTAQLVGVDVPLSASITASLSLQPGACSITVSESLTAKAILSAGGGTIGYYVEGGICCGCFIELCWRDEGNLFSWPGYSQTFSILPETPLGSQTTQLDTATICPSVSGAPGQIDYPTNGETFNQGDVSFMKATFTINFVSSGGSQTLDLDHQVWTSTCANDTIGSSASIKYGDCPSRTLHVEATNSLHPEAGSGSASVTVNVNPNDPATAPVPTIGIPGFNQNFASTCGHGPSVNSIGHVTDPDFDTHLLFWYWDYFARHVLDPNNDPGTELSSGVTPPLQIDFGIQIIRLIATDDAGHKGLVEIPITVDDTCVK